MTARRFVSFAAPLGVCALFAGWIALSAANVQAASFSLLIYGLANLIVYTDALDFLLRMYMRRRNTATAGPGEADELSIDLAAALPTGLRTAVPLQPYAIIASVFNMEDGLDDFMEAFGPYRERVWLISDGSADNTLLRLRQSGWRCFDDGINRHKPAAIRRLLESLPPYIETVLVVDPDVRIHGVGAGSTVDLERFIADFQQSGAAAACPRIAIEPDGFLARFQAFEYALAFGVGRASLADYSITSGAVSLYRRDALLAALRDHSLSVYAEDLENAVILLGRGERVYYDGRLVVSTEGPGSLARWFSQRVGWYHGLVKVYVERFGAIWRISRRTPFALYHFIGYVGILSLAVHPLKVASAVLLLVSFARGFDSLLVGHLTAAGSWSNPAYFMAAVGSYLALGVVALFTVVPRAERAYAAPIVPLYLFYALVHIAPMTIGYLNWIALRLWGRRVYHDHYEPSEGGVAASIGGHALLRRLR
ncbi:MAG TPA: glycosyltransferase family 2 protein [Steroidobacteraceae bacterium]|nr:glycosyltransferase family 2 protein [Steroidobacteraceae bacterium]